MSNVKVLSIHEIINLPKEEIKAENDIEQQPQVKTLPLQSGVLLAHDGSLSMLKDILTQAQENKVKREKIEQELIELTKIFEESKIAESRYLQAKDLIENQLLQLIEDHRNLFNIANEEMFSSMVSQWTNFKNQMDDAFDAIIVDEVETKEFLQKSEKLLSLVKIAEDDEVNLDEIFDGFLELTGEEFKLITKDHEIIKISGFVCGVTDRSLTVQPYQPIEFNHLNKIRPPMSVIKDDTRIFLDDIQFYNREDGIIKNIEDLEEL